MFKGEFAKKMIIPMMIGMFVLLPLVAFAQDGTGDVAGDSETSEQAAVPADSSGATLFTLPKCIHVGDCQIADAVNTVLSVAEFIFGIAGSLALLMFMYGGFVWVTSAGSSDRVGKGKKIIQQAVLGLLIVFLAAALVQFALKAFDIDDQFNLLQGQQGQVIKQKL